VQAITDSKQSKMSKEEWKNVIGAQGTKDEMDYLGLTDFLEGKESITKEKLLADISAKDIAPKIYITSIPKEDWVSEFAEYSLGFENEGTQEQIVFQIDTMPETAADIEFGLSGIQYQAPSAHVKEQYGRNQFAHARVQVGYGDPNAPPADIEVEQASEISEKLKNTLIIDEIQSDWIQQIQKEGTAKEWVILKGSDITKEFVNENYKGKHEVVDAGKEKVMYKWDAHQAKMVPYRRIEPDKYYTFSKDKMRSYSSKSIEEAEKNKATWAEAVEEFPIKQSKKYVELVLREMIKKATNDGRGSIAITNGNIQLNRSKEKGNKWFYDNIVLGELKKIAKQYGVKVETINIEPDKYLKLQENLKKIEAKGFEETTVTAADLKSLDYGEAPDFRELLTETGGTFRGEDFEDILRNLAPQRDLDEYVVFKNKETGEINFEYPVVNKKFMLQTDKTLKQFLEGSQQWAENRGEALIKMKLPKKLQKDILSKPIRLTKLDKQKLPVEDQTQRLFA
jgi:hypothetical protein